MNNPIESTIKEMLSYNAIYYALCDNRNTGKTTQLKKRGLIRTIKHNSIMVYVRRFSEELKEAKREYVSAKFLKVLNEDYPKLKIKKEDFKLDGNYLYFRSKPTTFFLCLQNASKDKSTDDVRIDTIWFEEYFVQPHIYRRYRGNEIKDLNTIFFTKKRDTLVKCIFTGNRESFQTPLFTYFKIDVPLNLNGIRTYRKGSFLVCMLNNKPIESKNIDYNNKVDALFEGTEYESYLQGDTNTRTYFPIKETFKKSRLWAQFDFGKPFTLWLDKNEIFADFGIDTSEIVFVDTNRGHAKQYILTATDKPRFNYIWQQYKMNNIYAKDKKVAEILLQLFTMYNII